MSTDKLFCFIGIRIFKPTIRISYLNIEFNECDRFKSVEKKRKMYFTITPWRDSTTLSFRHANGYETGASKSRQSVLVSNLLPNTDCKKQHKTNNFKSIFKQWSNEWSFRIYCLAIYTVHNQHSKFLSTNVWLVKMSMPLILDIWADKWSQLTKFSPNIFFELFYNFLKIFFFLK